MPPKVQIPRKPKLLRSNPLRKSLIVGGRDPSNTIDDEDLMPIYYRRHKFNDLRDQIDDTEISDEIKIRLMISRVKALQKHKEIYYNSDT